MISKAASRRPILRQDIFGPTPLRPAFPCATTGIGWRTKRKPGADGVQIQKVLDPVLAKVTNMKYRSFDLDYPDVERAQVFLDDLAQFESSNQMPALMFMRLPNDHTSATTPGKIVPLSVVRR